MPMFGVMTIFLLVVMGVTLLIRSNLGLGAVQGLFDLVPTRLRVGDAEILVQDNWVLRSSREDIGQGARMWGLLQLWTEPSSDPFPKGKFYRFEFTGDCDNKTDLIVTELALAQTEPIRRLFELPSEETRSANYTIDTFGNWGSVQTRIARGSRILLIIPELRVSLGVADPQALSCINPNAFRRAGSLPTPQDPLGVRKD